MMLRRKKLIRFFTIFSVVLIFAEIIVYVTLSSLGVLARENSNLPLVFAILTPSLIFLWTILLMKDLEYNYAFKNLKKENELNLGLKNSYFNDYNLFNKSLFGIRAPLEGTKYYLIAFTPCNQEITANLVRNEVATTYNGLIATFIENYFTENTIYNSFDHSYCFHRNTFVVLLMANEERLSKFLEDIQTNIYKIAKDNEIRLFVQPYIGVTEFNYKENLNFSFENASLSRHQSEINFEPITFYDPSMKSGITLSESQDILDALKNKEFVVYYQPKFSLKTHSFTSSEALIRWDSKKYGFLAPVHFIDKAEKAGLIHEIDMYVFNRVCEDLNDQKRRGRRFIPVSVNFSLYEFYSPTFVADIIKCIDDNNIPRNLIEIEITETTSQSNPFIAISIMKQLRGYGLRVLMDDFGCGFSNFSNLRKLPIDCLKIDKSFIDDIVDDEKTREIVKFLIALGKNAGMEVIAEGVDNAEQVEILTKAHLDTIQGYFYSKPISKEAYDAFLASNEFEKKGVTKQ